MPTFTVLDMTHRRGNRKKLIINAKSEREAMNEAIAVMVRRSVNNQSPNEFRINGRIYRVVKRENHSPTEANRSRPVLSELPVDVP